MSDERPHAILPWARLRPTTAIGRMTDRWHFLGYDQPRDAVARGLLVARCGSTWPVDADLERDARVIVVAAICSGCFLELTRDPDGYTALDRASDL